MDSELKKTLLKIGAMFFIFIFIVSFRSCFYKKVSVGSFQNSGKKNQQTAINKKTLSLKEQKKIQKELNANRIDVKMSEYREYVRFENSLKNKFYDQGLAELENLLKNPEIQVNSEKKEFVKYNIADIYFYKEDFTKAKALYEKFIEEFPDSQLAENASAAIEYIKNIEKYKSMYVSPQKDNRRDW